MAKENDNTIWIVLAVIAILLFWHGGRNGWFSQDININDLYSSGGSSSSSSSSSGGSEDDWDEESNPTYDCYDSDGGKDFLTSGYCEDSFHMAGFQDTCDGSYVKEYYCNSIGYCDYVTQLCQTGYYCINGMCAQPACSGIPFPTGPESCSVGYCSTGTCTFYPATLVGPARCGCA